jgi:hypothetical protein
VSVSPDNDNQPVTVIVPGPGAAAKTDGSRRSRPPVATLRLATIVVLCLMLLALIGVIVVLPDLVAKRVSEEQKPAPAVPVETPPPPPSADTQRLARDKREAENKLGIALRKQTELEAEGVAIWGGQDYDAALDSLAAGDAQLQAGRYAQAALDYEKVSAQLDALRASMAGRLALALQAGEAALQAGDGPASRHSFNIALGIDPSDQRGQQGMLRARVLEEVLSLIAAAEEYQSRHQLDAALDTYAAALSLDARSPQARAGHEAVSAKIRQREFHAAMSVALAALETQDFAASRAALTRADGILPGTPEVADTRRRLSLAVQRSRISAHRNEALALERNERWQEAGEHYAAVLRIDSNTAFAQVGRERSIARARIHAELDAYLAELARLNAPGPRDNARRLLDAAADLDIEAEPKLVAKVGRLTEALEIAQKPVRVRLQSDNLTDVAVYKVGRFGRFARHDLLLPPGNYVAVGSRSGYRDVRVEFTLSAGQEPGDVFVRCQEKI